MNCQMRSTGLISGHFDGNGMSLLLGGMMPLNRNLKNVLLCGQHAIGPAK